MIAMIAIAFVGLLAGCGVGLALHKFLNARTVRLAREEAQDIVGEAKEAAELKALEEKERIQEIEMEMWTKVEPDMLKVEGRIEELQEVANEKKNPKRIPSFTKKKKETARA
ncbi:hypothetical protein [Bdellovibrio bacteriovorus]|uniref:hypothetical protein n=1 Tax=Bdellovibrio bacteriovorus TaxID=959 RepID=UPI0035A9AA7C